MRGRLKSQVAISLSSPPIGNLRLETFSMLLGYPFVSGAIEDCEILDVLRPRSHKQFSIIICEVFPFTENFEFLDRAGENFLQRPNLISFVRVVEKPEQGNLLHSKTFQVAQVFETANSRAVDRQMFLIIPTFVQKTAKVGCRIKFEAKVLQ